MLDLSPTSDLKHKIFEKLLKCSFPKTFIQDPLTLELSLRFRSNSRFLLRSTTCNYISLETMRAFLLKKCFRLNPVKGVKTNHCSFNRPFKNRFIYFCVFFPVIYFASYGFEGVLNEEVYNGLFILDSYVFLWFSQMFLRFSNGFVTIFSNSCFFTLQWV